MWLPVRLAGSSSVYVYVNVWQGHELFARLPSAHHTQELTLTQRAGESMGGRLMSLAVLALDFPSALAPVLASRIRPHFHELSWLDCLPPLPARRSPIVTLSVGRAVIASVCLPVLCVCVLGGS